ncbi:hypothetical protein CAC42_1797 [Sphaceloma murrayae]|uniref:Uncharacterized protein n=1 Tax=Sphaceloma murrayae TaxID=2082308 RepID=A0A2K1QVH5_9PEZI|nr:hypothetical protein CAC42_1797 [Sphaceloma murrayae]
MQSFLQIPGLGLATSNSNPTGPQNGLSPFTNFTSAPSTSPHDTSTAFGENLAALSSTSKPTGYHNVSAYATNAHQSTNYPPPGALQPQQAESSKEEGETPSLTSTPAAAPAKGFAGPQDNGLGKQSATSSPSGQNSVATKTSSQSREAYMAKLVALKTAKPSAPTSKQPSLNTAPSLGAGQGPTSSTTTGEKPSLSKPAPKRDLTEILKQKIAELKAQKAKAASEQAGPPLLDQSMTSQPATPAVASPLAQTPPRTGNSTPLKRKRPTAAEMNESGSETYSRGFGPSNGQPVTRMKDTYDDERMIIEASSSEEEDDDDGTEVVDQPADKVTRMMEEINALKARLHAKEQQRISLSKSSAATTQPKPSTFSEVGSRLLDQAAQAVRAVPDEEASTSMPSSNIDTPVAETSTMDIDTVTNADADLVASSGGDTATQATNIASPVEATDQAIGGPRHLQESAADLPMVDDNQALPEAPSFGSQATTPPTEQMFLPQSSAENLGATTNGAESQSHQGTNSSDPTDVSVAPTPETSSTTNSSSQADSPESDDSDAMDMSSDHSSDFGTIELELPSTATPRAPSLPTAAGSGEIEDEDEYEPESALDKDPSLSPPQPDSPGAWERPADLFPPTAKVIIHNESGSMEAGVAPQSQQTQLAKPFVPYESKRKFASDVFMPLPP